MGLWPSTRWGNFTVGAIATVVGPVVLRPILVGIVRAGYEVKDYTNHAWSQAKNEAVSLRDEAVGSRSMEAEIRQLREEVAALKTRRGAAAS